MVLRASRLYSQRKVRRVFVIAFNPIFWGRFGRVMAASGLNRRIIDGAPGIVWTI